MQVAVVYSLPSRRIKKTEFGVADEDSREISQKVRAGLIYKGYKVEIRAISEERIEEISKIKADCVFNLIEWCGEDIPLAQKAFTYLRKLNIPITGSSERLFVLTGDKAALKKELLLMGASTPKGQVFSGGEEKIKSDLTYPLLVKPSCEHCSMGLSYNSIAHSSSELKQIVKKQIVRFHQPALVEEFIVGRELMVYLLEIEGRIQVLPIEEVIFKSNHPTPFQTYNAKWNEQSEEYNSTEVELAKLTMREKEIIETETITTFKKLGLWGYARFDMRLRGGKPYILEANANPSVYDGEEELKDINSEVIWGIKFPEYLEKIVKAAIWHYERGERV